MNDDFFDVACNKIKTEILSNYNVSTNPIKQKVTYKKIDIDNDRERIYDSHSDTYIPLKFTQFSDGEVVISVISEFLDAAKQYFHVFASELFSEEAFHYLYANFSENLKDLSLVPYTGYNEMEKYLMIYGLENKAHIRYSNLQSSTIPFTSDHPNLINMTQSYTTLMPDRIYYGTLLENKIVSIVGHNNEIVQTSTVVDIGLETHEDYRRKGYALSNVAAMSDYLLSNGHVVKYCCNSKNINSIKTAIASGFNEVAREKTFWCVNN